MPPLFPLGKVPPRYAPRSECTAAHYIYDKTYILTEARAGNLSDSPVDVVFGAVHSLLLCTGWGKQATCGHFSGHFVGKPSGKQFIRVFSRFRGYFGFWPGDARTVCRLLILACSYLTASYVFRNVFRVLLFSIWPPGQGLPASSASPPVT
jgi:hypothetical protein